MPTYSPIVHTVPFKGALYIIQILCRRYTFWSDPAGLTIADPPASINNQTEFVNGERGHYLVWSVRVKGYG